MTPELTRFGDYRPTSDTDSGDNFDQHKYAVQWGNAVLGTALSPNVGAGSATVTPAAATPPAANTSSAYTTFLNGTLDLRSTNAGNLASLQNTLQVLNSIAATELVGHRSSPGHRYCHRNDELDLSKHFDRSGNGDARPSNANAQQRTHAAEVVGRL